MIAFAWTAGTSWRAPGLNRFDCGLTFDEAIAETTEALKAEAIGIPSDIDVQRAKTETLGADMPPYRILGACDPLLAH